MRRVIVNCSYAVLSGAAWVILRVVCRLRVEGREHLPRRGGAILAVNHVSFLDPVAVAAACPRRLIFLARRDLFEIGWLGRFMRFLETIRVSRSASEPTLREAAARLKAGQVIAMFPEGVRQGGGAIGPSKPGVGWLAATAGVPIIPVLLTGTDRALPYRARLLRPAKITVAFGPQIGYANTSLSEDIYQQLAEQVTAGWHRLLHPSGSYGTK